MSLVRQSCLLIKHLAYFESNLEIKKQRTECVVSIDAETGGFLSFFLPKKMSETKTKIMFYRLAGTVQYNQNPPIN